MALRWVLAAAVAVVASAAGFKGPEAPAPTSTTELERLKALVSQLAEDHSADEPQQKAQELPELKPRRAPEPEFASKTVEGMVSLETTTRSSGVPNPEGNANEAVMVFDEAASSVERSLRRLMPSPAPTGKTFCTACHQMHNGAVDEAGAEMCSKKQGKGASKLVSCYKKYGDCPSDMSEYTCDGDAPPPPSPPMVPEGMCTPAKVHAIRTLKAEVRLCPMRPNCRGMSGVLPPRPPRRSATHSSCATHLATDCANDRPVSEPALGPPDDDRADARQRRDGLELRMRAGRGGDDRAAGLHGQRVRSLELQLRILAVDLPCSLWV